MNYWLAHVRGADYKKLRDKGFVVLYPTVDDYVFLAETEENKKLLRKQGELMVHFLRHAGKYVTITEKELDRMRSNQKMVPEVGDEIKVISGVAENLEGTVVEVNGTKLKANVRGFKRVFEMELDFMEVTKLPKDT